jgi:hypothetical protein
MRRALWYLLYFSLVPAVILPLWKVMMGVERADIGVDLRALGPAARLERREVAVHRLAVDLPWEDAGKADELMRDQPDGVFHAEEPGEPLVVFGSRRQAWVRGLDREGVAYAVAAMSGRAFQSDVVVPVSTRYGVTFSLLCAGAEKPREWQPSCTGLEDLLELLSQHLHLRVSSQVRYFVDESRVHPHHWSADALAPSLERPIDLVFYYQPNATRQEPYVIPGAAGVVSEWNPAVWREQLKALLGFPRLALPPFAVRFAPCSLPQWELELWSAGLRHRLERSARATLASLPNLMDSMAGMPVSSALAARLRRAVAALHSDPGTAWEIAEESFFDPAGLPLLYFPADHQAAVYIPVFFPPAFAILSGWVALLRLWRSKRAAAA